MAKQPSRILNDDSLVLGLDRNDIMGIAGVFYSFQIVFRPLSKEYLSLLATLIFAVLIINIRLKYRRKIIRDALYFYFTRYFKGGLYYDSIPR